MPPSCPRTNPHPPPPNPEYVVKDPMPWAACGLARFHYEGFHPVTWPSLSPRVRTLLAEPGIDEVAKLSWLLRRVTSENNKREGSVCWRTDPCHLVRIQRVTSSETALPLCSSALVRVRRAVLMVHRTGGRAWGCIRPKQLKRPSRVAESPPPANPAGPRACRWALERKKRRKGRIGKKKKGKRDRQRRWMRDNTYTRQMARRTLPGPPGSRLGARNN